jgi:glycosyltransferase involved in cell wall biosynthesis
MKRIVGIVSFMNQGGAQEAMLRLMRQLRRRGYDTETWFLYAHQKCYCDEEHVRLLRDEERLTPAGHASVFLSVLRNLRRNRPDAVIGFLPLACALGLTAATLAGVPVRVAAQRTPSFALSPTMRRVDRLLGSTPAYKAIACVGDQVRQSFSTNSRAYCRKMSVVPNGVDWAPSPLTKSEAREKFGLPKEPPLFVATGRFGREKNYPFLVRVAQNVPESHFAIAGDGELLSAVHEMALAVGIGDRFHLLGGVARSEIPHLLRSADGFVHASLFEGHSNSILEAMHERLPIVANDVDTIREAVVDDSGNPVAQLCPANDVEAWTQAIARILKDSAFAKESGARGRALVERRFTLDAMVDSFETLLLALENGKSEAEWRRAAA